MFDGTVAPPATGESATGSHSSCDHRRQVIITISIVILILSLLIFSALLYAFFARKWLDQEKTKGSEADIAMKKLGWESDVESVNESLSDTHAVTLIEVPPQETPKKPKMTMKSWHPGEVVKSAGWWKPTNGREPER